MKALRNQWQLTQRELAALPGVGNVVIAMYEKSCARCRRKPR